MIRRGSVGPLLLISLAIMGSKGPATIGLVAAGSVYGVRRSIPYWVAIAAVFASGRLADAATLDAAAKVAVLTAMIILICATWLVAGTSIAPLLRNPRRPRLVNAALAVGLVGATAFAVLR